MPTKRKLKNVQSGKFRANVRQMLGAATAPCLGYWGVYFTESKGVWTPVDIPGLTISENMGDAAEVEIEWTCRIVKKGRVPKQKCENPWPAHRCRPFTRK